MHDPRTHLDDGTLVRWLDGECRSEEERLVAEHFEHCERCQQTAAELDRVSERLGGALLAFDDAVSRSKEETLVRSSIVRRFFARLSRMPALVRWTAGAVALTLVVTASPVRAWLVAAWERITNEAEVVSEPDTASTYAVSFAPTDSLVVIALARTQETGVLWVIPDSGGRVSTRILGAGLDDAISIGGGVVRIANDSMSGASYEVIVPVSLAYIEIRVGERLVGRYRPASLVGRVAIRLGAQ